MADHVNVSLGDRIFYQLVGIILVYLPPRILYLVEDYRRPLTWLTIILANLPIIVHFLFGKGV